MTSFSQSGCPLPSSIRPLLFGSRADGSIFPRVQWTGLLKDHHCRFSRYFNSLRLTLGRNCATMESLVRFFHNLIFEELLPMTKKTIQERYAQADIRQMRVGTTRVLVIVGSVQMSSVVLGVLLGIHNMGQ
jgi:hypothetical protein